MSSEQPPETGPDALVESAEVAPTRLELRLDDALKAAAKAEAENAGEDLSEWVRCCMRMRLAQIEAVRAIQAGVDPETMLDSRRYTDMLADLARRQGSS